MWSITDKTFDTFFLTFSLLKNLSFSKNTDLFSLAVNADPCDSFCGNLCSIRHILSINKSTDLSFTSTLSQTLLNSKYSLGRVLVVNIQQRQLIMLCPILSPLLT